MDAIAKAYAETYPDYIVRRTETAIELCDQEYNVLETAILAEGIYTFYEVKPEDYADDREPDYTTTSEAAAVTYITTPRPEE